MSSSDELIRLSPDEAFVLYDFAHRLVLDIARRRLHAARVRLRPLDDQADEEHGADEGC